MGIDLMLLKSKDKLVCAPSHYGKDLSRHSYVCLRENKLSHLCKCITWGGEITGFYECVSPIKYKETISESVPQKRIYD